MARGPRSTVARLRALLLVALVALVAGVALLFLFGRAGRQPAAPLPDEEEPIGAEGEDVALIGEDFDYTFTEGEKPLFRIRGESIKADRAETIYLDRVALTLYDTQGRAYAVSSRQASFNPVLNEGRLQGRVRLQGPSGLTLHTPELELRDKGRMLVSTKPVEIGYLGRYRAHADRLRVHLPQEMYVLVGKVAVDTVPGVAPPVRVRAERMVYERRRRRLRVEGKVRLARGGDQLQTQIVNAFLSQDETSAEFVRAVLDVQGVIAGTGPGAARVRFSGKTMGLLNKPGPGEARHIDLDGATGEPATLTSSGGGVTRRLTAKRIEADMAGGALTSAVAVAGVDVHETGGRPGGDRGKGPAGPREAHARRAEASFANGQLAKVTLIEGVRFRDGAVHATGNRATLDMDRGQGELFGSPVEAESDRGRMTAPHVLHFRDTGMLQADGGVRAMLRQAGDTALAGTPMGDGEGPVWVESKEAFWRSSPQSFLFRGDVRAWRGKDLLLAGELRGDQQEDRLVASGGVKTLWIPEEREPGKPPKRPASKQAAAKTPPEPIEVTAAEMTYQEKAGRLNYRGDVRVVQQTRTLTCAALEVELGEDREAKSMVCTGAARLNDPQTGRTIAGEKAVYQVGEKVVEISGSPVKMRDREGNQVQGQVVVYHMDDGKVEVRGKAPAAAPAPAGAPG